MNIDISRDPKFSKIDHLFVLLTEGKHSKLPEHAAKAVGDAGFEGRSDESITVLAGEPRKLTLIGLGKSEKLALRGLRAALTSVARTAKKQRDKSIAVFFPYTLPNLDAEQTTRLVATFLAGADYKYDT